MTPAALVALLGGGTLVLALLGSGRRARPTRRSHPDLAWVVRMFGLLGYPLPAARAAVLVVVVASRPDGTGTPPDPWTDWIGVLHRDGRGALAFTPYLGTGSPGWLSMWGKGRLPSPPEGVSRLHCPQYSPDAYGGGYHHWREDRPAFRQVSTVVIDIFDKATGLWRGPIRSTTSHHNCHTTSGSDWRKTFTRGVRDWSHGCPVVLRDEDHAEVLEDGGWTADINGCRLALAVLPWNPTLEMT